MKRCAALALALLVLASCDGADPGASSSAVPQETDEEVAPRDDGSGPRPDDDEPRDEDKDGKKTAAGDGGSKRAPTGKKGRGSRDAGADDGVFNDSGTEDDNSSAVYPAAGDYLYSQSGFEKFCNAGRCDRQALPKEQAARIALRERTQDRAVVVTETSASDDRMLRTTATYSRADVLITDVYTRLSYEAFVFENEYHPSPPVESLRFPLRDGAAWRGRWEDSTSGTYVVRVFGPTEVGVRGRAIQAFQVATTTRFRGEFTGEAKTISWIDPATKAIVKMAGSIDLDSTYGRYVTEFSSSLRSGPGY